MPYHLRAIVDQGGDVRVAIGGIAEYTKKDDPTQLTCAADLEDDEISDASKDAIAAVLRSVLAEYRDEIEERLREAVAVERGIVRRARLTHVRSVEGNQSPPSGGVEAS